MWATRRSGRAGNRTASSGDSRSENEMPIQIGQMIRKPHYGSHPAGMHPLHSIGEKFSFYADDEVAGFIDSPLRKEVDRRQIEFLKSGKLLPVHFSSRYYDFRRGKWAFGTVGDEEAVRLIERKIFWQTRASRGPVWMADPTEALYLGTATEHLLKLAAGLEREGLIKMAGEYATAASAMMGQHDKFEGVRLAALKELEKKHEFERG